MNNIIEKVLQELEDNTDEKTRTSGPRYFKESVKLHGVKTAERRRAQSFGRGVMWMDADLIFGGGERENR